MNTRHIIGLASIVCLAALAVWAAESSGLTFSASTTGTPTAADTRAIKWLVDGENAARALTIPPGTPLATNNPAAYRASYLTLVVRNITASHAAFIVESAGTAEIQRQLGTTEADVRSAIIAKLQAGLTPAQILQLLQ